MSKLIIILTILSLMACVRESNKNLIVIEPNSQKGFNFPYILFLPDTISNDKDLMLIVEPNNSGFADDDFKKHMEKAMRVASRDFYIGNFTARRLKYPLLVPVFPRPKSDWKIYTHALDRDAIVQKNNPMERLDIQLVNMIRNACDTLLGLGYSTQKRVILTGFSASGTFANRFSLIHPDKVFAVAAGGLNGLLMLPVSEINSRKLNYPLGTNDFKSLFNEDFDSLSFKRIPQFLFMGKLDENDAVLFDDGYDADERESVFEVLGAKMQPDRWNSCIEIYKSGNVNATLITFDSIGHEQPLNVKEEILSFLIKSINSSDSTSIQ